MLLLIQVVDFISPFIEYGLVTNFDQSNGHEIGEITDLGPRSQGFKKIRGMADLRWATQILL